MATVHVRTRIRAAAVAALTGLATTGTHVFASRVYNLRDADLPCLLVSTDDEDIDGAAFTDQLLERSLQLRVRACQKATAALDDALDQMLLEVEQALTGNSLGGLCKPITPQSIRIVMDGSLEKPTGTADIVFQVTYFTAGTTPETPV
jgi:hypothetical protein